MVLFLFVLIGLIGLALFFILPSLLNHHSKANTDADSDPVLNATRHTLQALKLDAEQGLINKEQLQPIVIETQSTLALELANVYDKNISKLPKHFFNISTLVVALFIPLISILLYLSVGNPQSLTSTAHTKESVTPIKEILLKLEQNLKQNPNDSEGWYILAKTYMVMQRYELASDAFLRLYQLNNTNPDVIANYADALTRANQGKDNQQTLNLIKKALEINPSHSHSLLLAGMAALKQDQFIQAIDYFNQVKSDLKASDDSIPELNRLIELAKNKAQTDQTPVSIKVDVKLDKSIQALVQTNDSIFIFAKSLNGSAAPLAVVRRKVSELPLNLLLNDSMRMQPNRRLSDFKQIQIQARVSKSGQAIAQKGDLESNIVTVDSNQTVPINLTILNIVK